MKKKKFSGRTKAFYSLGGAAPETVTHRFFFLAKKISIHLRKKKTNGWELDSTAWDNID
jgi:hypothetical protein